MRSLRAVGVEKVEVAGVCDLSAERLERAGEIWPEAHRYGDFRRLLEPGKLDLVIVAAWHHSWLGWCVVTRAAAKVLDDDRSMVTTTGSSLLQRAVCPCTSWLSSKGVGGMITPSTSSPPLSAIAPPAGRLTV